MDPKPLSPPGLLQPLTRAVQVLLGHLPPTPHPTPPHPSSLCSPEFTVLWASVSEGACTRWPDSGFAPLLCHLHLGSLGPALFLIHEMGLKTSVL